MARPRNRFVALCNQTRSQTWRVEDRQTGKTVPGMEQLINFQAKDWVKAMNEDAKAGRPVSTPRGEIA